MFHMPYFHPSSEMAHTHNLIVYAEDNNRYSSSNRMGPRYSQGEITKEQKIGQNILLNKVIIALDAWKLIMLIIMQSKQSDVNVLQNNEQQLYSWCQKIAFLAFLEIYLKIYSIRKENQEIKQIISQQDQIIEIESQYIYGINNNMNQTLISDNNQQNDSENLELIPILTSLDFNKLKIYLFLKITKTEILLGLIIEIIHFGLFIYGNFTVFYINDIHNSFIYKTTSIYLLIGFLVFCIPMLFILIIAISIPVMILGYIFFKRNIFQSVPVDDSKFEKRLTSLDTVDGLTNKSEYLSKDCSICLRGYEVDDKVSCLPCSSKHHFHKECILRWLKINSMCPICRYDLNQQATELRTIERTSSDSENNNNNNNNNNTNTNNNNNNQQFYAYASSTIYNI